MTLQYGTCEQTETGKDATLSKHLMNSQSPGSVQDLLRLEEEVLSNFRLTNLSIWEASRYRRLAHFFSSLNNEFLSSYFLSSPLHPHCFICPELCDLYNIMQFLITI